MSCEEFAERVGAVLDGEATIDEVALVETHLAACARCRQLHDGMRALKHAISRLDGRASPPDAIRSRIEALRFARPGLWAGPRADPKPSAALLIGLAFAVAVGRSWFGAGAQPSLPDELIADHLKYVPETMPAEVASDDRSEVRRFFEGKVEFEPFVPQLEGSRLIGGRACRIEGRMVQLLFYERGQRKLSLYVSDESLKIDGCSGRAGHSVCGLRRGNLSLMLVGDEHDAELRRLLDMASTAPSETSL